MCLLVSYNTYAVPAKQTPITIKQPNGKTLTYIVCGDERINWAKTTDDYTLLTNSKGNWVYAILNKKKDLEPSSVLACNEKERSAKEKKFLKRVKKNLFFSVKQVNAKRSNFRLLEFNEKPLVDKLSGTSSLIFYNDKLLTMNDHKDPYIYFLNNEGSIIDSINTHLHFADLEDMAQDEDYIYLGDFGNNAHGNREDLCIYKIKKSSLKDSVLQIDTLSFSYSNQKSLERSKSNQTDFDCEAMIATPKALYLFNKQWLSRKTTLYRLDKNSRQQSTEPLDTYDVNGLVTGATYLEDKNEVYLVGYNELLQPFYVRLYGFKGDDFLSGKEEKHSINMPFHQIEAIEYIRDGYFYLTNESFSKKIISVGAQIHCMRLAK